MAKLVAVVTQREWRRKIARQRLEPREMRDPLRRAQIAKSNPLRPAPVAKARNRGREGGRLDRIVKIGTERQDRGTGQFVSDLVKRVEARAGIEPACGDLQSPT